MNERKCLKVGLDTHQGQDGSHNGEHHYQYIGNGAPQTFASDEEGVDEGYGGKAHSEDGDNCGDTQGEHRQANKVENCEVDMSLAGANSHRGEAFEEDHNACEGK